MHRRYAVAGLFVVASIAAVVALTSFTNVFAVSEPKPAQESRVIVTAFSNAQITATCDRVSPGASLGLSNPTLVSRMDASDAVIFATSTKYSACILSDGNNVSVTKPIAFERTSRPIDELESISTLAKLPGQGRYATNAFFVMRVGPTVTTLQAATKGLSQVSPVVDGFAFVHLIASAKVHGKFAWGVAAGFSAGGELVGSETLR
jgi:hypothetical protein